MGKSKNCIECGKSQTLFAVTYAGIDTKAKQHFPEHFNDLVLPGDSGRDFLCVDCANKRKPECVVHGKVAGTFGYGLVPKCESCLLVVTGVPFEWPSDWEKWRIPSEVVIDIAPAKQSWWSMKHYAIALTDQAFYRHIETNTGAHIYRSSERVGLEKMKRLDVSEKTVWFSKLRHFSRRLHIEWEGHPQMSRVHLLVEPHDAETLVSCYQALQEGRSLEEVISRMSDLSSNKAKLTKYLEAKAKLTKYLEAKAKE